MEPLSTTTALASIIGLIGQFKSGRDSAKSQDFNEFMQWLVESNHAELKSLIEANHGTTISIKAILHQSQEALSESLSRIDNVLAAITTALSGFGELSKSIRPNAVLSEQAVSILKELADVDTGKMMVIDNRGMQLMPISRIIGKGARITITEQRFIEDDLQTLTGLTLLNRKKDGTTIHYTLTRKGYDLVKAIHGHPITPPC